ncbi:MAG: hypothetical protein GY757_59275, partial [bacterium]|nr:hypothetical protein [bacterium]
AARMNKAGYKLEVRDIFKNPSIGGLAGRARQLLVEEVADQSIITGNVPLTPIQKEFFLRMKQDPHHYNQAVMFYSAKGFDEAALRAIFTKIQEHHDALRMTFNTEMGEIIQKNHGLAHPLSFETFDFRNSENASGKLEDKANEIQKSINLETGPLMKLGLFQLDDGDRLLIVSHHLVIDGVSWRILFEDIESLYQQFQKGAPLELPLKTGSFKEWAEKLSDYGNSSSFLEEKSYWKEMESKPVPVIDKDFPGEDNFLKDTTVLSFGLNEEETGQLLTKVNEAFNTEINDILLAALGLGTRKTYGHDYLLVALEGHGREEIIGDVDINRVVGWFTTISPVLLDISYEDDLAGQVKEIKENLRRIPKKGIGFGILKHLTAREHKEDILFKVKPRISFNYLGQFDSELKQMSSFEMARESVGISAGPNTGRDYEFDINGIISSGCLQISVSYNKAHHKEDTVREFTDNFKAELQRVIAFCSSRESRELTP